MYNNSIKINNDIRSFFFLKGNVAKGIFSLWKLLIGDSFILLFIRGVYRNFHRWQIQFLMEYNRGRNILITNILCYLLMDHFSIFAHWKPNNCQSIGPIIVIKSFKICSFVRVYALIFLFIRIIGQ